MGGSRSAFVYGYNFFIPATALRFYICLNIYFIGAANERTVISYAVL